MFAKGFVFVCLILSAFTAQAAKAPKAKKNDKPFTHIAAAATAHTFNRLGTVDNLVRWIALRYPEAQVKSLKANLAKAGVKLDQKLPKVSYKNDTVIFDKNFSYTYKKHSIVINGKEYGVTRKPIDVIIEEMYQDSKKKTAMHSLLLIPEANAGLWDYLGFVGAGTGLGCAAGTGIGALFGNPLLGAGIGCATGFGAGNISYLLWGDKGNDEAGQAGADFVFDDIGQGGTHNGGVWSDGNTYACEGINFRICYSNKATMMFGQISTNGCFQFTPAQIQMANGGGALMNCSNDNLPVFRDHIGRWQQHRNQGMPIGAVEYDSVAQ